MIDGRGENNVSISGYVPGECVGNNTVYLLVIEGMWKI